LHQRQQIPKKLTKKIEKNKPDRFVKLRRTLYLGTTAGVFGAAVMVYLVAGLIKKPFVAYDTDLDVGFTALNMVTNLICAVVIMGLGGLPGQENKGSSGPSGSTEKVSLDKSRSGNRNTLDGSGARTTMDDSSSLNTSAIQLIPRSNSESNFSISQLTLACLSASSASAFSASAATTAEPSPLSHLEEISPRNSSTPSEMGDLTPREFSSTPRTHSPRNFGALSSVSSLSSTSTTSLGGLGGDSMSLEGGGLLVEKEKERGFAPSLPTYFEDEEKEAYVV